MSLKTLWPWSKSNSQRGAKAGRARTRRHFLRLVVEPLEVRSLLATILVTTELDLVNAGDGLTSLREAVIQANNQTTNPGHDTITFASALANKPVLLLNGQIGITDLVTIRGLGAAQTTIDGQNATRLFDITITNTIGDVTFDGLKLTGGKNVVDGKSGGAIRSPFGIQLIIQNSTISGNSTAGSFAHGGGIYAKGSAKVLASTISDNSVTGSNASGGGIYSNGSLTVTNSTVSGNSARGFQTGGGGLFATGSLAVTNSTISGNLTSGTYTRGGGIWAVNSLTITNSTITGNSTSGANAVGGGVYGSLGPMTIRNSIVAGNFEGDNTYPDLRPNGTLTVQFSLIGNNTGAGVPAGNGNLIGIPAMLGPLVENGGPTRTHRPLAGSPVIDAGNEGLAVDSAAQTPLTTDQRGVTFARFVDGPDADTTGTIDMGAVELAPVPFALVVTTATDELDVTPNAADLSLREAIALANGGLCPDTITFAAALAGQPILLGLGQMTISDPLTIRGLGAGQTTVMGSNTPQLYSRLFDITNTAGDVTFDGLTLTGGKTTADEELGGAIRSASVGLMTIQNSTVSGNSTAGFRSDGGGIFAAGAMTVTNSSISGNSTAGTEAYGGGIFALGAVTVTGSTISSNSTTGPSAGGGGMLVHGSLKVTNSTISGNSTAGAGNSNGGGIWAVIALTVTNSTITGNSVAGTSADGGGVYNFVGPVAIRNSIVAGNLDTQDGSHPDLRPAGTLTVQFSLIGNNTGTGLTEVPAGTPDPSGNGNVIGGGTDATRINPRLAPLANNGGPTQTHALCTAAVAPHASCTIASPAINAGSNALIPAESIDGDGNPVNPLPFDQRGSPFSRVLDSTVDMGAVEVVPLALIVTTANDELDTTFNAADLSLREAITLANAGLGNDTITFAAALAGQPILLTLFQMTISAPLTIRGLGAGQTTVNGGNASRLFDIINNAVHVTFDGLTLTGGKTTAAQQQGGAIRSFSPGSVLTIQNSAIIGNSTTGESSPGGGIFARGLLTVTNSTISGNSTSGVAAFGGGVFANDSLTVTNSTISGNSTTGPDASGGGILANVSATVTNSTISNNSTTGTDAYGGGISAFTSLTVTNSTISGNSTMGGTSPGGGISSAGSVTVANSTISGNSTRGSFSTGGGISAQGSLTVANSTISGNSTFNTFADGGGIFAAASVTVANSTITGNSTGSLAIGTDGGGVYALNGPVAIRNSVIAGNLDPQDGSHPDLRSAGTLTVQFSLIGDNNGSGLNPALVGIAPDFNLVGTHAQPINPRLAPLANNGGPTQTHALCTAAGAPHASCTVASPALNAGSNALIPADTFDLDVDGNTTEPLPLDQRGAPFNRVSATTVDMGALESQPGFPWHNFAKPFDVGGGPNKQPDGSIVAGDALDIINYLNAFGAGPVPAGAELGQPFGFLDVSGGPNGVGDNFVTAGDALDIINFLNAGLGGEGEPSAAGLEESTDDQLATLIELLASDLARAKKRDGRPAPAV